MRSVLLTLLVAVMSISPLARSATNVRGAVAFHYEQPLSPAQLEWYSRFDILVIHDPLPVAQRDYLHARGTHLVLYEWAVAFYESRATPWQRSLLRSSALLNRRPLRGGVGSTEADAWYFDPADAAQRDARALDLADRLRAAGVDGVFLDTTTVQSLHPSAREEFARRHPDLDYDDAYALFLQELRRRLGTKIVFTNQGFRAPRQYLPNVDWDLTESLLTWPRDGKFSLRPWNDPSDPWNSVHFLMLHLIEPARRDASRIRFAHLNYAEGGDHTTAQDVFVVSRIFDAEAYVAAPSLADEKSSVYFAALGAPKGDRVDAEQNRGSYRFFEHALLAVAERGATLRIANGEAAQWTDTANRSYRGETLTLTAGSDREWTTWILLRR